MLVERRDQQGLNLDRNTQTAHRSCHDEHNSKVQPLAELLNRWARISCKAADTSAVFNNLHSHINVSSLKEAYKALDGNKALGVDGISKAEYGKCLETSLQDLTRRVQVGSYKPQPKREVQIPKADGETLPLTIACFEDKLVDWVVGKLLSAVFESLFIRNSFGYRPNKSAHKAVEACYYSLAKDRRQHIVEIDFSSFFNTVPHRKIMKVLGKRISDKRFKGLIGRFLKGKLLMQQGETLPSKLGTPQGSIMSPVLANIYLNEVLDQWFIENHASYNNVIVRYADDAIFFFKKENEAKSFMRDLSKRVKQFGLTLNEAKTKKLTLTKTNHKHFHFLGFTFYWGKRASRKILKVKTQKKKLVKSIQDFYLWIKTDRNREKLQVLWSLAKAKIEGHVNYFGYWTNVAKLNHFYSQAISSLYKWLNRRSQRRSYTWEGFCERVKCFPLIHSFTNSQKTQTARSKLLQ